MLGLLAPVLTIRFIIAGKGFARVKHIIIAYHLLNEGNWGYKETEGGIIKLDEHG